MSDELDTAINAEYERDRLDDMRETALDRAINTLTRQPIAHTPQDIVGVAEIFYQFLKGETK
jgi:hypothetical protein